jgi:hypothetical protein
VTQPCHLCGAPCVPLAAPADLACYACSLGDQRAGHPDPSSVLYQGDHRWGRVTVGRGPQRFGAVGCLVTSVAQALRILGVRAGATPLDVQRAGLAWPDVWAPGSSGAVVTELVRAQKGVVVGGDYSGAGTSTPPEVLRPVIADCIQRGGVALVAVDYDRDMPAGDPTAEHWGCAYAAQARRLWLTDPATAKRESVDLATLAGPVSWGSVVRPYVVVRVVTVFRD